MQNATCLMPINQMIGLSGITNILLFEQRQIFSYPYVDVRNRGDLPPFTC